MKPPRIPTAPGDDRGSVTIEAAISISALIVLCALIVAGVVTLAAHVAAIDLAGAAARGHAIGRELTPGPEVRVTVTENAGIVTAAVTVPAPLGAVTARAFYPVEYPGEPR
ncbi:hypothetical protein M0E87_02030 [Corynebacterium sp. CCM 9185]|uniref:TadE-like protein n=1 Tax=Corynebacterium marambiense TaxID=2765364 RepID=A0ABS0VS55_9CORY|nr:hypothetical protein [Corynebacterium marambiense]MBI8999611.1 hypothetical protein [Corynebacterium marambiense]MCK7662449.1 hypothetical protein [Corynebacterium marambiense]MCX7541736.1 hypothetical protein [Corynebacterium marambiense]